MKRTLVPAFLSLLFLSNCATMAPKYVRPAAPVPGAWPSGEAYGPAEARGGAFSSADLPWGDFFRNGSLRKVIALSLSNNRDLKVAALAIERSQALYGIRRADLFPQVDATGGGLVTRTPETLTGTGKAVTSRRYDVGLAVAGYELDFFGRVRSLKDRALSDYLATEQARRSVQVGLVSEVAVRWFALAADRERLGVARETLSGQEKSYELTKRRFEGGVSSELDLRQAQTSVDSARVDIARYTALVAQDRNALDLLAGAPVPEELLPAELDTVTAMKEFSTGLPAEVLLLRPDILEAEEALKGANANIGAARAAFFPRITLTTSVGLGSEELGDLFRGAAGTWSFAPRVSVPIFDGGANRASLKVAEADRDIAVARYEKAIQAAFHEVADALALRGTLGNQLSAQQSLVDAATVTRKLSDARYEKGVDSYLSVLDAQRTLYAARQDLIAVRLALLANRVTLYRVLGGGG
ncbi:MAG: efflux transporter outer membrane subunit [bacterium]|jgi:multidrug efflux system outer membrane protein